MANKSYRSWPATIALCLFLAPCGGFTAHIMLNANREGRQADIPAFLIVTPLLMALFIWVNRRLPVRPKEGAAALAEAPPFVLEPLAPDLDLEQLRLKKRELAIKKKEVAQDMKHVREAGRAERINLNDGWNNLMPGPVILGATKWKKIKRQEIAMLQEQMISQLQKRRDDIDGQLLEIEKRLLSLDKE